MNYVNFSLKNIKNQNFKLKYLVLFFSLLSLWACEEEKDFGTDVLPSEDLINASYSEDFDIKSYTIADDKIRTDRFQTALLGSYFDPIFGFTKAEFATQLRLFSSKLPVEDINSIDSLVIQLACNGTYKDSVWEYSPTGKTNVPQTINIYEITDEIKFVKDRETGAFGNKEEQAYYSNSSFMHNTAPLASFEYTPQKKDSIIRIKLPKELAISIHEKMKNDSETFESNENFQKYFKGLLFKTDDNFVDGAIGHYQLFDTISSMSLHYIKNVDPVGDSDDDRDTLKFTFSLSNIYSGRAAMFEHDYSQTNIQQAIDNPEQVVDTVLYLQSMAGVKAKIYLPEIKNRLVKDNKKVIINKANLVLPVNQDILHSEYPTPEGLQIYYADKDGNEIKLKEYWNPSANSYGGESFDKYNNCFMFSIPTYIQSLIDKDGEGVNINTTNNPDDINYGINAGMDYGLYITTHNRNSTTSRIILNSHNHPTNPIKLKITYTVLD